MTPAELYPARLWTTAELFEQFGEEVGIRRELIDGVLHVTPSPLESHQTLAMLLCSWLYHNCPEQYAVTQGVDVEIDHRNALCPDVQVITAEALARRGRKFAPHEVLLAVEIVSPSTKKMDRILKPAVYAEVGIQCYWRIEAQHEVEVHTYQLDPTSGKYLETGIFTDLIEVDQPWPIRLQIKEITPRSML